jgi:hypothetical protein
MKINLFKKLCVLCAFVVIIAKEKASFRRKLALEFFA